MSDSREPSYYEVALTNRQVTGAFLILLICLLSAFFAGVWLGLGQSRSPGRLLAQHQADGTANPAAIPEPATADPAAPNAAAPNAATQAAANGQAAEGQVEKLDFFSQQETNDPSEPAAQAPPGPAADPTPVDPTLDGDVPRGRPEKKPDGFQSDLVERPPVDLGSEAEAGQPKAKWKRRAEVAREAEQVQEDFDHELTSIPPAGPATPSPAPVPKTAPSAPGATSPGAAASARPLAPLPPGKEPAASGPTVYVVQVVSTKEQGKARQILSLLQDGGYPALMSTVRQPSVVMYRVRIGPYRDRSAAQRVADDVQKKFKLDTWITNE